MTDRPEATNEDPCDTCVKRGERCEKVAQRPTPAKGPKPRAIKRCQHCYLNKLRCSYTNPPPRVSRSGKRKRSTESPEPWSERETNRPGNVRICICRPLRIVDIATENAFCSQSALVLGQIPNSDTDSNNSDSTPPTSSPSIRGTVAHVLSPNESEYKGIVDWLTISDSDKIFVQDFGEWLVHMSRLIVDSQFSVPGFQNFLHGLTIIPGTPSTSLNIIKRHLLTLDHESFQWDMTLDVFICAIVDATESMDPGVLTENLDSIKRRALELRYGEEMEYPALYRLAVLVLPLVRKAESGVLWVGYVMIHIQIANMQCAKGEKATITMEMDTSL